MVERVCFLYVELFFLGMSTHFACWEIKNVCISYFNLINQMLYCWCTKISQWLSLHSRSKFSVICTIDFWRVTEVSLKLSKISKQLLISKTFMLYWKYGPSYIIVSNSAVDSAHFWYLITHVCRVEQSPKLNRTYVFCFHPFLVWYPLGSFNAFFALFIKCRLMLYWMLLMCWSC